MSKKYYWLRLKEDFFEKDEIKIIEGMPNGKDYILFYMKLLLKSISNEGKLRFRDTIPYTPEMLATITNTNVDTVRIAVETFRGLGLMDIWDDQTIFMVETENMIGSETKWAEKKRIQRERKKDNLLQEGDNVLLPSSMCPTEIEKEIEIDIEIDKDIEIKGTKVPCSNKLQPIMDKWNSLGLSQIKSIQNKRLTSLNARIKEYGLDNVVQAIDNIDKSSFLKGENDRNWTITFDWLIKPNNFTKVLEGQYTKGGKNNGGRQAPSDNINKGEGEGERLARLAQQYTTVDEIECDF